MEIFAVSVSLLCNIHARVPYRAAVVFKYAETISVVMSKELSKNHMTIFFDHFNIPAIVFRIKPVFVID